jgi:hypothetical protein
MLWGESHSRLGRASQLSSSARKGGGAVGQTSIGDLTTNERDTIASMWLALFLLL